MIDWTFPTRAEVLANKLDPDNIEGNIATGRVRDLVIAVHDHEDDPDFKDEYYVFFHTNKWTWDCYEELLGVDVVRPENFQELCESLVNTLIDKIGPDESLAEALDKECAPYAGDPLRWSHLRW